MSLAVFLAHPHPNDSGGGTAGHEGSHPCSSPAEPEGATDFLFLSFQMHSGPFQGTFSLIKENCIFYYYYFLIIMENSCLGSMEDGQMIFWKFLSVIITRAHIN